MSNPITRRTALKNLATGSALAAAGAALPLSTASAHDLPAPRVGRYKHSACKWCYRDIPLEEFAAVGREIGLDSIELVSVEELPILARHGLACAMVWGVPGGIVDGLNERKNHDAITAFMTEKIPAMAEAGQKNMIVFSGNRRGLSDAEGLEICAEGLDRITPIAQKHGVTLCMELLNSKVNHQDYQCDTTPWGVQLCEKVGSEHFKLLYDIYHMQIMEGDMIRTIRDHHKWIGHYHTGGNPGRNELDGTFQEINYPAVMRAIAETGYTGFVGQEFVPTEADPLVPLRRAIQLCTV
ncbi:hydroxypyruvate isomerase family protein [Synoicihabitans lomoniglobus]|uniref:TIM barrel protein n=1 Tax=Synoicihabitans lomoniglobus TaxID=2909285 RepID=A0AAF0CS18_9BACT|nr:TIM barrel protein [Opitutaceae bacterium LMO-M01]WED66936.1 TIM barrel protein [Opitutaceae bacterium LMO-M01]